MSILNRTNDGFWGVLLIQYHLVNKSRSIKKEDLIEKCAPGSIEKKDSANTLKKWIELGLFNEIKNDDIVNIQIPESYQLKKNTSYLDIVKRLPKILRQIIFSKQNNEKFWDTEKAKSADFTRALCWILSQNIYEVKTTTTEIEKLEDRQLKDAPILLFQNTTRWPAMAEWMLALGFAWQSKKAPQIEIDPTIAIQQSLIDVFKNNKTLAVQDFLERLSDVLPVIDTGSYRLEVEKKLDHKEWNLPKSKYLSTSLSRALKRLDADNLVIFEVKADSQKNIVNLTAQFNKSWGEITHVSLSNRS
jgi:hypothetical protein